MTTEHRQLQRLPASEFEAAARALGRVYDAILDCHRCSCGGRWLRIIDVDGHESVHHVAPLGQGLPPKGEERRIAPVVASP